MKKILKNPIYTFIIGALIFGSASSVLAYGLLASRVAYTPTDTEWKVNTVGSAINELRDKTLDTLANEYDIVSGKEAVTKGKKVVGTLTGFTNLSDSETIEPDSSSTVLNGYYNASNYNVSCSNCTSQSYVTAQYDAKYNVVYTSSSSTVTIYKTVIENGEEVKTSKSLKKEKAGVAYSTTLDDIKININTAGGNGGPQISIINNSTGNISYGQKLFAPGATLSSFCWNCGNFSSGNIYTSSLFN